MIAFGRSLRRATVGLAVSLTSVACAASDEQTVVSGTDTTLATPLAAALPEPDTTNGSSPALQAATETPSAQSTDAMPHSPRRITRTLAEVWRRGGHYQDTVIRYPGFIATDGKFVYVLDRDPHAVTAFRIADGSAAWKSDTIHPVRAWLRDIEAMPSGGVVILEDWKTLHRVSAGGQWKPPITVPTKQNLFSLCVPDDSTFVLYTLTPDKPLVRLDSTGTILEEHLLPWPDLVGVPHIATQSRVTTGPDGQCVIALTFGHGFATFRGATTLGRHTYVEEFVVPKPVARQITLPNGQQASSTKLPPRSTKAVASIAVQGSTILVLAVGRISGERYQVIDVYDLNTGAYRESWRLPFPSGAIAATADLIFAVGAAEGYPALVALKRP